jgi:hypothetical protein
MRLTLAGACPIKLLTIVINFANVTHFNPSLVLAGKVGRVGSRKLTKNNFKL